MPRRRLSTYDPCEVGLTGVRELWLGLRKYWKDKDGAKDSSGARKKANKPDKKYSQNYSAKKTRKYRATPEGQEALRLRYEAEKEARVKRSKMSGLTEDKNQPCHNCGGFASRKGRRLANGVMRQRKGCRVFFHYGCLPCNPRDFHAV